MKDATIYIKKIFFIIQIFGNTARLEKQLYYDKVVTWRYAQIYASLYI